MTLNGLHSRKTTLQVIATLYVAFSAGLGLLLLGSFAASYREPFGLHRVVSFQLNDYPSNLQPGCMPRAYGTHYFGDFWSVVCHSKLASPYLSDVGANYLPLTYWLASLWARLATLSSPLAAIILTSVLMLASLLFATHALTANSIPGSERKRSTTFMWSAAPFYALSVGTIMTFDRGNIQWSVTALFALSIVSVTRGWWALTIVSISIGAALKGYPLIALIPALFAAPKWSLRIRLAAAVGGLTSVLFFFPLAVFNGGLRSNVRGLQTSLAAFADAEARTVEFNHSLVGFTRALALLLDNDILQSIAEQQGSLPVLTTIVLIYVAFSIYYPTRIEVHWTFSMFVMTSLIPLTNGYVMTIWLLQLPMAVSMTVRRLQIIVLAGTAFLAVPKGFAFLDKAVFLTPLVNGPLTVIILLCWLIESKSTGGKRSRPLEHVSWPFRQFVGLSRGR